MFNWFQNVPNNTDGKKQLQDKLISLSEKCVLQTSGAKKSVAWGRKKGAFFSPPGYALFRLAPLGSLFAG